MVTVAEIAPKKCEVWSMESEIVETAVSRVYFVETMKHKTLEKEGVSSKAGEEYMELYNEQAEVFDVRGIQDSGLLVRDAVGDESVIFEYREKRDTKAEADARKGE